MPCLAGLAAPCRAVRKTEEKRPRKEGCYGALSPPQMRLAAGTERQGGVGSKPGESEVGARTLRIIARPRATKYDGPSIQKEARCLLQQAAPDFAQGPK